MFLHSHPPPLLTFTHYLSCMEHLCPGNLTDLGNSTFGFHILGASLKCSHRVMSFIFNKMFLLPNSILPSVCYWNPGTVIILLETESIAKHWEGV